MKKTFKYLWCKFFHRYAHKDSGSVDYPQGIVIAPNAIVCNTDTTTFEVSLWLLIGAIQLKMNLYIYS